MDKEGIAKGIKHSQRKPYVYQHRMLKYINAIDLLCKGEVTPEYVAMRGRKFKEVKDWK